MPKLATKTTNTKITSSWRRNAILVIGFLLALVVYDLSIIGGNNIRLYAKWATCGQWPVETVGYIVGEVPNYRSAQGFSVLLRGGADYFCTPLEAEKAGYSANPDRYEFPNLNAEKEQQ